MRMALQVREARPASVRWNVVKTIGGMIVLWSIFFLGIPFLCYLAESVFGLEAYRFAGPGWTIAGLVLVLSGSALHLVSDLVMALGGDGTPWYFDAPRRLVIAGPYRFLRNPMTAASLAQGVGVGLWLGSPLALTYAVASCLLEHFVIRPWEEADLERRFGEMYRRYRRRVRCWRPRLHGYDPAHEGDEPPVAAERTKPPGRYVVLYDGHCHFCTAGAAKLSRLVRPGVVDLVSFQEPGALERFPGLTREACMRQMHLVTPAGRVYGGFEAAVQAVATRPVLGWVAYAYYLPGLRLAFDLLYALLAANRYRIMGKALIAEECKGGTCALHFRSR